MENDERDLALILFALALIFYTTILTIKLI
jgi:hypothetical protein